ncbi:cytochrome P450 [Desarmillaria ectypa]|nr:cytochrome P450 [Desarmillaria ectypa]
MTVAHSVTLAYRANQPARRGRQSAQYARVHEQAALDIIGISFRYEFNSLSGRQTELMTAANNLFGDYDVINIAGASVFHALAHNSLVAAQNVAMKVSRSIYEKQLKEVANDIHAAEKDVVNVLTISHLNDDAKKKMNYAEIDSQLATFILAGHDTTAMAWLLYELSLHPEDQAKIREEIAQTKSNASGVLISNDYDSMLLLNACNQEALRFHPLGPG